MGFGSFVIINFLKNLFIKETCHCRNWENNEMFKEESNFNDTKSPAFNSMMFSLLAILYG